MEEILTSSYMLTSNGSCCKRPSYKQSPGFKLSSSYVYFYHCLYLGSSTETNRKYFRRYCLKNPCISCVGSKHYRKWQRDLFLGSSRSFKLVSIKNMVASVESKLVLDEDEVNSLVLKGKKEFDENFSKSEAATWENESGATTWGNFEYDCDSDYECMGANKTSVAAKFHIYGTGVHFLEERDEKVLSSRILTLSRRNKVRSAMELLRSMELSGLRPDVHACNSLLSCLLRKYQLDDAMILFDFMKRNEITTGHTYSLIIKGIAGSQGCDAAVKVFEKLETEFKVREDWDAVVYNTMISVCGRENDWIQTHRIWRSMKENGKIGTAVTYRILVCTFVRCWQNDLAIDAYSEMVQSGLKPAADAMQAVIGACSKEGKLELALSVFCGMLKDGLKPNLIACNVVINSLAKDGKVKLAFKMYNLMKSMGHIPDSYTWYALLSALYRANRYADALQLFKKIRQEHGAQLNLQLYNLALMSCQRLGLWERAVQLLWQMEVYKLSISAASYNLVIGACETAGKPEAALQVYNHMVDRRCTPDTFTYLSLARSCIWGSLWPEVEEILKQVAPSASLYNAVIHGMCLRGKAERAKELYLRMHEIDLKPDGKTRAMMLQKLACDSRR